MTAEFTLSPERPAEFIPELRLVADGVSRSFGPRKVIRSLSLEVASGEVLAVRGANGSGKSTLLRLLAGLLRPTGGETWVEVRGRRVSREQRWAMAALAAPAIQPYLHLTLAENLRFLGAARGGAPDAGSVADLCRLVGLSDRRDQPVASFSSGMLQRVRLALAVAARPPVLLLDEPSQCLDGEGRALVAKIVEAQRSAGVCVIATNDDSDAAFADRSFVLEGSADA